MPTQWEYKLEELSSDVATVTQHLNDESRGRLGSRDGTTGR